MIGAHFFKTPRAPEGIHQRQMFSQSREKAEGARASPLAKSRSSDQN